MALEQTKLARSLAHKLSSQCHDSPGTYKILTNDVRRCRNVLEQLEEGLSEETIDENRRVKVLPIAESANHILQKLDLAIQSYRCSKDPQIDQGIVVAFKSHVQSITDDLTAAYDALTDSAEIAIRFDPRPSLDSAVLEPVSAVSSTNASARDGVRPESLGSSAWSTPVQHDTQSQSSKTELSSMPDAQPDQFEVAAGDGKEVYTSPPVRPSPLLDPNSTRSSQQRGRSPSILSPLYTDPFMSTTLENASSSILCDDETDDVPSSPFDETQPMKPEALERQPSSKGSPSTVKALDVAASPSLPFVSESEPKSESEPESESEPRSEPEPEAESELEPESKPQPESKSESKSESKPESKPRSNSESEPAIGTVEEPSGILENDTADPEIHRREVDAADVEPEFVGPVGSRIQERSTTVRRIVPWPGAGVNIENKSQPQPSSDGSYVDVEDHQPSVQLTSVQDQPKNSTQDAVSAPESPVPEAGDVQQGHGESDLSWEMPLSVLRNQRRWDRFYKSPAAGRLAVANNPTETPGAMSPSPDPRPHAEVSSPVTVPDVSANVTVSDVTEDKPAGGLVDEGEKEDQARNDFIPSKTDISKPDQPVEITPQSPPVPLRQPPVPPPPQPSPTYTTVHTPARGTSAYKIVNADPHSSPTRSSSTASDDLYNSSRPSSPVRQVIGSQNAPQIPEIRLESPLSILDIGDNYGTDTMQTQKDEKATPLEQSRSETVFAEAPPKPPRPICSDAKQDGANKYAIVNAHNADGDCAKEAVVSASEEIPPPLPPRPPPRRQKTLSVSILPTWKKDSGSSLTPMREEDTDASGRLRTRSFDGGLNQTSKSRYKFAFRGISSEKQAQNIRDLTTKPQLVSRQDSGAAPERSNSRTAPEPLRFLQASRGRPPRAGQHMNGYYGPGTSLPEDLALVDDARILNICLCWNNRAWESAERYLVAHLESMIEQDNTDGMRRARHLLGVCASYRGDSAQAIRYFLDVLNAPIQDITLLDEGDCAAAYWLGDLYAVMNRRQEALLAYCIAERNPWFDGQSNFYACLSMEQESVQLGARKQDMNLEWVGEGKNAMPVDEEDRDSIIDSRLISKYSANLCLRTQPRISQRDRDLDLMSNSQYSRSRILFDLRDSVSSPTSYHRTKITSEMFSPLYDWPMRYDPTFAMSNVLKGRLLAYECDLLHVFRTNPAARIPKSLGIGRKDCFTHQDLLWLIKTIRDCLLTMGLGWSEVANVAGTWFCCRTRAIQQNYFMDRYFSISISRQALRSGYAVEVCPDDIVSSRLFWSEFETPNMSSLMDAKQYRKRIRSFLEAAAKNYNGHLAASSGIASERQRESSLDATPSRLAT